jgi:hypothetical protein
MENVNKKQEYLFNNLHKFQSEATKEQPPEAVKPNLSEEIRKDSLTKQIQQKWYRDQLNTQIGNKLIREKESAN